MAVADGGAERQRLLGQLERAVELALGPQREREIVERGRAGGRVVVLAREREALLELGARLGVLAAAGGEDAEDVVRLGQRAAVAGRVRELERPLGERLRLAVRRAGGR